jgi:hypothetical protein
MAGDRKLWGLVAEFRSADELIRGAAAVRDAGYTKWDAHAPFPVHGLDDAMGIRSTVLPWLVLGAGITGCALGFLMQWWMNAVDYRFVIGGKPFNSIPTDIPVMFEVTVLFAALTAFAAMIVLNGLPRLAHPLLRNARFRRVTNDAFFISIEAGDPRFDVAETEQLLRASGGAQVEWVEA